MTVFPTLLLASTSPYRKALLDRLGLPFACEAPGVEENERSGEAPPERALRLARAKAEAVAHRHPGALVIGSDQVASYSADGRQQVLHKPGDRQTCVNQLKLMSAQTVRFDTALAIWRNGRLIEHADITLVRFRALDDTAIHSYIDREPAFDCAGGFKIEGLGVTLFDSIESRDPTALIGLPLIAVCAALRQLGVAV